jgi:hypothetical protein
MKRKKDYEKLIHLSVLLIATLTRVSYSDEILCVQHNVMIIYLLNKFLYITTPYLIAYPISLSIIW